MKINDNINTLIGAIKILSANRLAVLSKMGDFRTEEFQLDLVPPGFWMGSALINGSGIRIYIKCFFSDKSISKLAESAHQKGATEINRNQIQDFIREYCNLTAGAIGRYLAATTQREFGTSLPLVVRGFDDIYFEISPDVKSVEKFWSITDGINALVFSTVLELLDPTSFGELVFKDVEQANTDDLEFL